MQGRVPEVGRMQSSLKLQSNIVSWYLRIECCQALRVLNSVRYYPIPFILIKEGPGAQLGI